MTQLNFGRDVQGFNANAPLISTDLFSAIVPANGNASFTVPSTHENWIMYTAFQPGVLFWVAVNGTATPPSTPTIDPSNSYLFSVINCQLKVNAGDVIDFHNQVGVDQPLGIALYKVN